MCGSFLSQTPSASDHATLPYLEVQVGALTDALAPHCLLGTAIGNRNGRLCRLLCWSECSGEDDRMLASGEKSHGVGGEDKPHEVPGSNATSSRKSPRAKSSPSSHTGATRVSLSRKESVALLFLLSCDQMTHRGQRTEGD